MVEVIAHIAGPSGSGKTELADVLTLKVSNIALIDLDIFDGQTEHTMNMRHVDKDSYNLEQLHRHHQIKQRLIDEFIDTSAIPIVFFGHIEEAGNVIEVRAEHKLVLTTVHKGAIRRGKALNLPSRRVIDLIDQGIRDIDFFIQRGYTPVTSRQVYRMILKWSMKITI